MKWEYKSGRVPEYQHDAMRQINAAGSEGWELVSVVMLREGWLLAFFKRPLPEQSEAPET
jgi:hypothetical protein